MQTRLIVGCPVRNRAWVLPEWFGHVQESCKLAGIKPHFAFVVGSSTDATEALVTSHGIPGRFCLQDEPDEPVGRGEHVWSRDRLSFMADTRNKLLRLVREAEPDLFLSLDSDVLLHPDAVCNLLQTLDRHEANPVAVGGKTYMSSTTLHPSYAFLRNGVICREDRSDVFQVDALMAIKLMRPAAYCTDYVHDVRGEDIGWSERLTAANNKLVWDGRVTSNHLMY